MLRRRGNRVSSVAERADDTPVGKLKEAIIESMAEFYSENLAQELNCGFPVRQIPEFLTRRLKQSSFFRR